MRLKMCQGLLFCITKKNDLFDFYIFLFGNTKIKAYL